MKTSASRSRARPQFKVRDMLKCKDIPVVINKELTIENDSSDAPCMGELVQDSDKKQSNCDDVQPVSTTDMQHKMNTRKESVKWTSDLQFHSGNILYHHRVFFTILNWLAKI